MRLLVLHGTQAGGGGGTGIIYKRIRVGVGCANKTLGRANELNMYMNDGPINHRRVNDR
jgi:hypothetical protein